MPNIRQTPFEWNQLNGNLVNLKKINIYNFYVYHRITIQQICINQPNGNLVVHKKIINIYLFPKLTEWQFSGT